MFRVLDSLFMSHCVPYSLLNYQLGRSRADIGHNIWNMQNNLYEISFLIFKGAFLKYLGLNCRLQGINIL